MFVLNTSVEWLVRGVITCREYREVYLSDRTAMYSVKTITDNRDTARETDNEM